MNKIILEIEEYPKTINSDNSFSQLVNEFPEVEVNEISIEELFAKYDELFYDIPLKGVQSHTYLSLKYNFQDQIQDLLDQVNELRLEIASFDQQLLALSNA